MIDAYDVLGLAPEAKAEDIKSSYKRLSLQYHPDKQQDSKRAGSAEKFNEITLAKEILMDEDRRKVYDTFGIDLGEERPEMEVWSIGISTLLSPIGGFALKTLLVRLALWFIAWKWIGRLLMFCGCAAGALYAADFKFREVSIRSPDFYPVFLQIGIVDVVVLLLWIWPLLADSVGVLYLVSEVISVELLLSSWQFGGIALLVSLVLARLLRGWWFWIVVLEALLAVVVLVALTIAAGIMRLWIDGVKAQRGEKLTEWRHSMRRKKKHLEDEITDLKRRLQEKAAAAEKAQDEMSDLKRRLQEKGG